MTKKHSKKPVEQESLEQEALIDRIAKDNPDLPRDFIKGILEGKKDLAEGRFTSYEVDSPK